MVPLSFARVNIPLRPRFSIRPPRRFPQTQEHGRTKPKKLYTTAKPNKPRKLKKPGIEKRYFFALLDFAAILLTMPFRPVSLEGTPQQKQAASVAPGILVPNLPQ
jgi:hypothetical protein